MNLRKHILPLVIAGAATISSAAQTSTFDTLINLIADRSPAMAADRARMQAQIDSERAANVPSNPEIEFEHLWNGNGGENRWSAGISQEIDWPGSYGARSAMISAMAAAMETQNEASRLATLTAAASTVTDIIAANKEVAILAEINETMTLLQEKIMKAWNNGETTILDVNKIKIETLRSATRLETAQNNLRTLLAELSTLCGGEAVEIPSDLDFPTFSLLTFADYENALHQSPQWRGISLSKEVAQKNIALSKSERLPSFNIGYNHAYEEGTHFNGLSVGMTLPVWSRKHSISASQNEALAAEFDAIALSSELTTKLHADYTGAVALGSQLKAFATAVEGTNNMALLRKAYEGGELSLLTYLQEVNYFLEARLDYLSIRKEYTRLLAALTIPLQQH